MKKPSYKNPAILEALCEIRFKPSSTWGISSFVEFAGLAKEKGYPVIKDAPTNLQVSFPSSGGPPAIAAISNRVQTWNEEGTQLWQASPEMFAANRRAPYQGWEAFRPHIFEGLEIYRSVAKPEAAEALIMQYVNRIELGSQNAKPSDHLLFVPPQINYAEKVINFVCRAEQSFSDTENITVTSTRDLAPQSSVAIILEIVYSHARPSLAPEDLADIIEVAHTRVIEAFEKSITDDQRKRMETLC